MRSSSTTKSGFDYGILAPYQINDDSPPALPAPGIDDESYVFDGMLSSFDQVSSTHDTNDRDRKVSDSTTITQEISDILMTMIALLRQVVLWKSKKIFRILQEISRRRTRSNIKNLLRLQQLMFSLTSIN
jgi:hypothetical protein